MTISTIESLQGISVLFISADTDKVMPIWQHFDAFNFNANLGSSISQCETFLQAKQYDLIIYFWQNKADDFVIELLSKIKNSPALERLPVVIISEHINPMVINEIIHLGIAEYIVLPLNQAILTERLCHAIDFPTRNNSKSNAHNLLPSFINKRVNLQGNIDDIQLLVVDDVVDNIEILVGILNKHYKVKAANNANSAMKVCLSKTPPDILLLDIMMPDIDGLTFCKQLQKNPLTQNIRIIFTTALTATDDIVRGLKLGAVDYITKPIIPEVLLARVNVHKQLILQQRAMQLQIDALVAQQNKT
ncbi:response regulator [Colwelliaceae bacterium BS250]